MAGVSGTSRSATLIAITATAIYERDFVTRFGTYPRLRIARTREMRLSAAGVGEVSAPGTGAARC